VKKKNVIPRFRTPAEVRERIRLAALRRIVAAPKGGALFEYMRKNARIELLSCAMGRTR
jgi:hypothetical protein